MKKELTNISEKSLMELEDIVNDEMLTTEDVNNMLEHTDKGRTKQTIRNCVTVLQKDPVLKKAIKRNELSGRMDIVKEVPWERRNNSPTVTDTDENNLKMYLEENYELTSERVIKAGVDIVSNENKYHPIRDYLESLQSYQYSPSQNQDSYIHLNVFWCYVSQHGKQVRSQILCQKLPPSSVCKTVGSEPEQPVYGNS